MLDNKQVIPKLVTLSEVFKAHMKNKQFVQAKLCYDKAVNIAVFMELDEEEKDMLFGKKRDRGEDDIIGLFPDEDVKRAYFETAVKKQAHEAENKNTQRNSA